MNFLVNITPYESKVKKKYKTFFNNKRKAYNKGAIFFKKEYFIL